MRFRQHRGSLEDAMETACEIPATVGAIVEIADRELSAWGVGVTPQMIKVEPYCFDPRIGWDTHIVLIDGYGVFGFTDSPVSK